MKDKTEVNGGRAGQAPVALTAAGVAGLLAAEFAADPDLKEEAPGDKGGKTKEQEETERTEAREAAEAEARKNETAVEKEAREAAEAAATAETDEEKAAREAEEATARENETAEEKEAREEAEAAAAGAANEEVPEALATAIEEWEAAGGGELPAALQGLVEKRINKIVGERETEKTARAAAEAKVVELEAALEKGPIAPAPNVGMGLDEKGLTKLEGTVRQLLNDAENYLDDSATPEEKGRVEEYMESQRLDAKGLKRQVRELGGWLQGVPGERARIQQFQAEEAKLEPEVKGLFPWLDNKAAPEYRQAQEVLQLLPELRQRTPAHRVALGVYVLGLKELAKLKAAKQGQPAKASVPAKVPPKTPAGGAATGRAVNGKQKSEETARQALEQAPTRANVTALLKQSLRG